MAPKKLNFITGNKNKLKEVQEILSQTGVELQTQPLDLPELQGTIEEITTDKCKRAADVVCKTFRLTLHAEFDLRLDQRTSTSRRYMSSLQRVQRTTWTLCVRLDIPSTCYVNPLMAMLANGSSKLWASTNSTSSSPASKISLLKRSAPLRIVKVLDMM